MAKTHYEVLGVRLSSSSGEIRSAYRKLVLLHHPDSSSDPRSAELFLLITQAYETLSEPERRRAYDELLRTQRIQAEQARLKAAARAAPSKGESGARPSRTISPPGRTFDSAPRGPAPGARPAAGQPPVTIEVTRLTMLYQRSQFVDAERLARTLVQRDPRQPIPYAVLGDLHRQRGELQQASKMYAYAMQLDPRNDLYRQRYEELAGALDVGGSGASEPPTPGAAAAPLVGGALVVLAAIYLVLSNENPIMPGFKLVSTWTMGLVAMLFLCGVGIGGSFGVGRLLDRFSTVTHTSTGRLSPSLALAAVAWVNFWAAALLYLAIGFAQSGFNFSTSRLVSAVAGATALLAIAAGVSHGVSGWQTFLWGGNLVYLGALCGWMVADSFRR